MPVLLTWAPQSHNWRVTVESALIMHPHLERVVAHYRRWEYPGRSLPIIVLTGPAGDGKDEILTALQRKHSDLHSALMDVAGNVDSALGILTTLARQLSLGRPRRAQLGFPRFLLGLLATGLKRTQNPAGDRAAMIQLQHDFQRSRVPQSTWTAAQEAIAHLAGLAMPVMGQQLAALATEVLRTAWRRRRTAADRWWQEINNRPHGDALLQLRDDIRSTLPAIRAEAELKLCRAFLVDLAMAYEGWLWGGQPPTACLALLDGVQTDAGEYFLRLLTRARAVQGASDPLLTVVGASGEMAVLRDVAPAGAETHEIEPTRQASWFHLLPLPDLRAEEVLLAAWQAGVVRQDTAWTLFRLTAGHRGGVSALLARVAETDLSRVAATDPAREAGAEAVGDTDTAIPPWLQEAVSPSDGSLSPLVVAGLASSLPGVAADTVDELTVCAAARTFEVADLKAGLPAGSDADLKTLHAELRRRSWTIERDGVTHLHQWLSWLLRQRLRARAGDHPDSWAKVHTRFHRAAIDGGDRIGASYHQLALGEHLAGAELRQVTRDLAEAMDEGSGWVTRMTAVTAAPCRSIPPRAVTLHELTSWAPREEHRLRLVAQLVAARRIETEPLLRCHVPGLRKRIGRIYDQLIAQAPPELSDELFEASQRYEQEEEWPSW